MELKKYFSICLLVTALGFSFKLHAQSSVNKTNKLFITDSLHRELMRKPYQFYSFDLPAYNQRPSAIVINMPQPGTTTTSPAKQQAISNLLPPNLGKPTFASTLTVPTFAGTGISAVQPANSNLTSFFSGQTSSTNPLSKNIIPGSPGSTTASTGLSLPATSTTLPGTGSLTSASGNLLKNPLSGSSSTSALSNTGVSGISNSFASLPNSALSTNSLSSATTPATAGIKKINDAVGKNLKEVKKPSISATLTLENDLQYNPVMLIPNGTKFQEVVGVKGNILLFGIPLSVNISNNQAAFNGTNPFGSSLYKFGFSPAMMSGLLRNQLQQYDALRTSMFHGFNFTDYVHQTITEQEQSLASNENSAKSSPFSQVLNDPNELQGLIKLSDAQLSQKLHGLATQNSSTSTTNVAGSSTSSAEEQANIKKADSLTQIISSIKAQLMAKGLDPEKLILAENYSTGKTSSNFNSSETLSGMTEKQPENGLQSVFSNVKDFRIGSFGTTLPGASGQQSKLMDGASATVKVGNYPLTFGFGKLDDINALKDADYQSSVYLYPQNVTYVGADMPHSTFGNVNVSVISSYSAQSNNAQYAVPTLPGNAVTFTVTKALNLPDVGHFSVDVSKSSTLYDNSAQPGTEAILDQKSGANADLSNNLFQAFSAGFTHTLDIKELNASDNVYFNYSGMGYQNPANNGYAGGAIKFGGTLKKKLYKNKLVLDLRSDYSNTPLSYTTSDKWKNYQVQLGGKYQFTNRLNFSLKYMEDGTEKESSGASSSDYDSKKLELDANDTYKIGKYLTTTHVSISGQTFENTYVAAAGSNLLNFLYVQTLVLKNSSFTGTLFYNKELSASPLIGDMLTTEMIYQYKLSKMWQLSSGFSYLNNSAIAQQAGIKQSIQLTASKHYDFSGSFNYMKNLMTPQYAELYPSYRGELTLRYHFKIN
jgi:hypothetical protein